MLGQDGAESEGYALGLQENFWGQEKTVDGPYLCLNGLRFRARLLALKNKRVVEEHSNWELEEGAEKQMAWTGATCELDVVDAQCTFRKSRRAAQSKTGVNGKGKSDCLQKWLSVVHSLSCWSEDKMYKCLYPSAGRLKKH